MAHAVEVIQIVHTCMIENYAGMKIPLESSIAIGRDFSCDIEIGTTPDRELIEKALDGLFEVDHEPA